MPMDALALPEDMVMHHDRGPSVPEQAPISILDLRDERVMLDSELAALFKVETRVFNQAFKRNQDRFPAGWAFELTSDELDNLKSQFVISS